MMAVRLAVGRHISRRRFLPRNFASSAPMLIYSVPHLISTLNPARIKPEDHLDLSRRKKFTIRFPESTPTSRGGTFVYRQQRANVPNRSEATPFPPQSTGFLYYHRAPDAAPLEGSIRFRVTPDNIPSSFPLGHDLAVSSGLPWQLLLLQLATPKKVHARFCDQLVHDKLVPPEQLAKCRALPRARLLPSLTLFRLGQPFPVNFDSYIVLAIVGEKMHRLVFRSIFHGIKDGVKFCPWAGSAVACLEPSTRPEYAGRRVIHLRILEITKQVSQKDPDIRLVKPEAGQLLAIYRGDSETLWAYDIDAKNNAACVALRALWDVSAAAGYFGRPQS